MPPADLSGPGHKKVSQNKTMEYSLLLKNILSKWKLYCVLSLHGNTGYFSNFKKKIYIPLDPLSFSKRSSVDDESCKCVAGGILLGVTDFLGDVLLPGETGDRGALREGDGEEPVYAIPGRLMEGTGGGDVLPFLDFDLPVGCCASTSSSVSELELESS